MGGRAEREQELGEDIADIAIAATKAEGEAVALFKNAEGFTLQKLAFAWAFGAGQQRQHAGFHLAPLAIGKTLGLDRSRQRAMGNTPVRRRQPPVGHSPSIPGKAASKARAPCPTPPLGRAGAGSGCQP